jgi:hypothetical protein
MRKIAAGIAAASAAALAAGALAAPAATAAEGTKSLAAVLTAETPKFDKNWNDYDIVTAAVLAVLDAKPNSTVGMPSPATALKVASSEAGLFPVRSLTRLMNAASVGTNAVRATLPVVKTPTLDAGFALRTASTASVTMSKSRWLVSNWLLSERRTAANEFSPRVAALAAGAARAPAARAAAEAAAIPAVILRMMFS